MIRKMHPTQEVYATPYRFDEHFIWMQFKPKVECEKCINEYQDAFQFCPILGEHHKVIRIPDVVCGFDLVFYELIQFIEIDIDEELGSQIPERESGT